MVPDVAPAQATKTMSGFASMSWRAKGVSSCPSGTRTASTVAPLAPRTALTAATLPWPKALSCAKTTTFLPLVSMKEPAVATSCRLWRPERKVYLLMPWIASVAAGPEM